MTVKRLIGSAPSQVSRNKDLGRVAFLDRPTRRVVTVTATAGQTDFTITGGYTPGYVDAFKNGIKVRPSDMTATDGIKVVLGACIAGDELEFIIWW